MPRTQTSARFAWLTAQMNGPDQHRGARHSDDVDRLAAEPVGEQPGCGDRAEREDVDHDLQCEQVGAR
jgi:hypothetical protein